MNIRDNPEKRVRGTVILFSKRGYGFVEQDGTRESHFTHVSQSGGKELRTGDRVEFEIVPDRRSLPNKPRTMAANVTLIDENLHKENLSDQSKTQPAVAV